MNEEKDALEMLRVKYAKRRWLKNQQDKSSLTFENIIPWIEKLHYTPSLGDIETSINLSYSDSDAGETP